MTFVEKQLLGYYVEENWDNCVPPLFHLFYYVF